MIRVLLAIAVTAATASADPRRLEIAGDACDATTLAGQVVELGAEPFDASASASVRVEIEPPFIARVSFDDGAGHVIGPRVIDAADCTELVTSIALVIATTPAPAHVNSPAPTPRDDRLDRSAALGPPRVERWDAIVGGAGNLDAAGVGGRLAIGARWRISALSIGAELRGALPEAHSLEIGRIDIYRGELAVVPCLHRGELAACGLALAGLYRGSGIGLRSERVAVAPLVALGLRAAWEHDVTARLAVRAYLEADALVTITRFDVGAMTVWTSPRIEASLGISLLVRFL